MPEREKKKLGNHLIQNAHFTQEETEAKERKYFVQSSIGLAIFHHIIYYIKEMLGPMCQKSRGNLLKCTYMYKAVIVNTSDKMCTIFLSPLFVEVLTEYTQLPVT